MAKRFEETGKTAEKYQKKLLVTVKVWRKFYYDWTQPGYPKPHPLAMCGELELKTPVVRWLPQFAGERRQWYQQWRRSGKGKTG
jgi:hypothetical protein